MAKNSRPVATSFGLRILQNNSYDLLIGYIVCVNWASNIPLVEILEKSMRFVLPLLFVALTTSYSHAALLVQSVVVSNSITPTQETFVVELQAGVDPGIPGDTVTVGSFNLELVASDVTNLDSIAFTPSAAAAGGDPNNWVNGYNMVVNNEGDGFSFFGEFDQPGPVDTDPRDNDIFYDVNSDNAKLGQVTFIFNRVAATQNIDFVPAPLGDLFRGGADGFLDHVNDAPNYIELGSYTSDSGSVDGLTAVPEPTSLAFLALSGCGLMFRRRKA